MSQVQNPEKPAGIPAASKVPRYFAMQEEGLRNGSFFRVRQFVCYNRVAQFANGDYMGYVEAPHVGPAPAPAEGSYFGIGGPEIAAGIPRTYFGNPLAEYDKKSAERLIPECCGGRR